MLLKLSQILDSILIFSETTRGCIQLLDNNKLQIVSERGFSDSWLLYWESVSPGEGSCGQALSSGKRVTIPDILKSKNNYKERAFEIQLKENIHASHSTPIVSSAGELLGMISSHYKTPTNFHSDQFRVIDALARHAADVIEFCREYRLLEQKLENAKAIPFKKILPRQLLL